MITIIKRDIPKRNRADNSLTNNLFSSVYASFINGGGGYSGTIPIIDELNSELTTAALSARQGKILNENKLSRLVDDRAEGNMVFVRDVEVQGTTNLNDLSVFGFSQDDRRGMGVTLDMDTEYTTATSDIFNARVQMLTDNIQSSDYYKDVEGWGIWKDINNKTNLDIDNIKVRGRMDVNELRVEQTKYVGGRIYCTYAGIIVSEVRTYGTLYRLLFKTENADGLKINNQFQVNDLAFSQTFNNNKIRRYWRKVVGIGENYIDVSIKDCELDSDIPEVGDSVVQLGNATDKERQGAVVIAPLSFQVFQGINTYNLPSPTIDLNPDLSVVKAKLINAATNEDVSTSLSNLGDRITAQAERVTTDDTGLITNISKNGLVITDDFAGLFSQEVDKNKDIVKQAQISTFITTDDANNLISNATIEADKINFTGKTIINNNFTVDTQGNLTVQGTIHADKGYFRGFLSKGITKLDKSNINKYIIEEEISPGLRLSYFDFENLSNILYFNGSFKAHTYSTTTIPVVYLPSIHQDQTYTQDKLDEARSYIDTDIYIYNYSDTTFAISGLITDKDNESKGAYFSTSIQPNVMYKFKCKHRWYNGNENVYWYLDKGTFK